MKRSKFGATALAGMLVLFNAPLRAQTSIDYFAQFGPGTTVQYLPFNVTTGGTFTMQTWGLRRVDPMISLFTIASFNGAGLGAFLGSDDDGAPAQAGWNTCTGLGGTCHSFGSLFLTPGGYTLALSTWDFSEAEARAGTNSWGDHSNDCSVDGNWDDCNYHLSLTSSDGVAGVVPEPASMTLLATGLVGMIGAGMRRRKKA